jgi:hypothetical protein
MALFDLQQRSGVTNLLPAVQLRFLGDAGQQYYQLSRKSVAYSVQLEAFVIADYAGDGSVRGIEFLNQMNRSLESYVGLALTKSRGALLPAVQSG